MDDLQYSTEYMTSTQTNSQVLNLVINGWPSIQKFPLI